MKVFCISLFLQFVVVAFGNLSPLIIDHHANAGHNFHGYVSNITIAGTGRGCAFTTPYFTTAISSFPMCTGQKEQDLKNGMSIINLINSRGYLPTCRVMQLMLWMASAVSSHQKLSRETFVDVGANIGSCTVHMASLGFPVVSVEPVQEHVDTIQGSIDINPSFHIELNHIGISSEEKVIHANFGHGGRNWGATEFHEVSEGEKFETVLKLKSLDQVIAGRKVSLLKVDCEGCEWAALKSARRVIRKIPMIKLELVQNEYTAGNETVTPHQILTYLEEHGFDLYTDLWAEDKLYFGKRGNEVLEIDRLFGSTKFKLRADEALLHDAAKRILKSPISASNFNQKDFLKQATDVIAIEKSLSQRMHNLWTLEKS